MEKLLYHFKNLCDIQGVSGDEGEVCEYIIKNLPPETHYIKDNLGNLIVTKKGESPAKEGSKLMISSHMDEVGFIITAITDDGMLKFSAVGGIDEKVIFQRNVLVGSKKIHGIIASNPIHLLDDSELDKSIKIDNLYIDIGACSKTQANELVNLGDYAGFLPNYQIFGDGCVRSKAIDDRFGCAVMLTLLFESFSRDTTFVFCVQEEVGLCGSTVASYSQNPDFAIILDATTAGDIAGVSDCDSVCNLSKGAVLTIMDRHTIYDKTLVALAASTAKDNALPFQYKKAVAGGNDAGAIHKSRGGVRCVAVSLPTRYIHSENCVAKILDIQNTYSLTKNLIEAIAKLMPSEQ